MRNVRLESLDAGHLPQEEQPEALAACIRAFLKAEAAGEQRLGPNPQGIGKDLVLDVDDIALSSGRDTVIFG